MVGIPHYNAFLRHLSNQCTNLASSSVIFLATQSTAFLWPGNLYLTGIARPCLAPRFIKGGLISQHALRCIEVFWYMTYNSPSTFYGNCIRIKKFRCEKILKIHMLEGRLFRTGEQTCRFFISIFYSLYD